MIRLARVVLLLLAVYGFALLPGNTPAAEDDGFQPLFNGKDLTGWQNASGREPGSGWVVQDGAMARKPGAGMIWTKGRFGDFILDMEFKTEGNSGIFIRTGDPKDPVQTGLEVAINRPSSRPGKHSCGAIYDCLAPTRCADKPDAWNHVVIKALANRIQVTMNDQQIIDMDLDRWTQPHRNPDGSRNKFRTAVKDFPRAGHVGLQDHGASVWFRNIKIKPLTKK